MVGEMQVIRVDDVDARDRLLRLTISMNYLALTREVS